MILGLLLFRLRSDGGDLFPNAGSGPVVGRNIHFRSKAKDFFVNIPSFVHVLFAQVPADKSANSSDPLALLIILVPMAVLFYFMLYRPHKKDQAKRQEMLDGIKKNDTVITIGGMYGVVMKADKAADEVVLRVDDVAGTKIRFTFGAIAKVITSPGGEASNASAGN